jgi:hypothetical protein
MCSGSGPNVMGMRALENPVAQEALALLKTALLLPLQFLPFTILCAEALDEIQMPRTHALREPEGSLSSSYLPRGHSAFCL